MGMNDQTRIVDKDGWTLLQHVDQNGEGLTQWEVDFIESLTEQLLDGKTLTEAQKRVLLDLAREKTPDGYEG